MRFEQSRGNYLGNDTSTRMLFNFRLCDYLIKQGCTVLGCGIGHKDGEKFIVFAVNDRFKDCMLMYHK